MGRLAFLGGVASRRRRLAVTRAGFVPPGSPGDPPAGPAQQVFYTEDTSTDFITPERGWFKRIMRNDSLYQNARSGDSSYGQGVSDQGYAIVYPQTVGNRAWLASGDNSDRSPFRLDNFIEVDTLPQSLLDEVLAYCEDARTAGIKLRLRFRYSQTNDPPNDAPLARTLGHIEQLAPYVNAGRDVVTMMDLGFVGAWGEWAHQTHYTSNSQRNQVIEKLLQEIHPDIMLCSRRPRWWRDYFDPGWSNSQAGDPNQFWWKPPLEDRFDGSDKGRMGWNDDSWLGGNTHAGTFDYWTSEELGDFDREIVAWIGQTGPSSGETSAAGGNTSHSDCPNGNEDHNAIHYHEHFGGPDTLHIDYWTDVYDKWKSNGCWDEITRRLGYRLVLNHATLPEEVTPGAGMSVQLDMSNVGVGKVFNRRPIDIVFTGPGGPFTARLTSDARRDLPLAGQTVGMTFTADAPSGLQVGQEYDLHVRLPDPDPLDNGLDDDARFAIRLANVGMWDGSSGRNDLDASVAVVS